MMEDSDLAELKGIVEKEREHLNIGRDFSIELYECYPKPFEYCCKCEPIEIGDRVVGVTLRINYGHSLLGAILDSLHEMWHAREYYANDCHSELRADIYALTRIWKYFGARERVI